MMSDINVALANPDDYETVGSLITTLLIELFPGHYKLSDESKYIAAAKRLLKDENNVWAFVAKTDEGEMTATNSYSRRHPEEVRRRIQSSDPEGIPSFTTFRTARSAQNAGEGEIVGVLTLNQCTAIYANGNFGEISEFYVKSNWRSSGVGAKLIQAAKKFGMDKGWSELEVGAPPQPTWQRTLDFYISQGFEYSGPRLYCTF